MDKTITKFPQLNKQDNTGWIHWFYGRKRVVLFLIFLVIGMIFYANSLNNGFHYDDEFHIVKNEGVHHIENLPGLFLGKSYYGELPWLRAHYRPLVFATYMLDYYLGGLNPLGYHLSSLFIHILTAFMVTLIMERLAGRLDVGLLSGLLFLLHPFNAEAVNYITARSSQMYALFYLISFYGYIRYRPPLNPPVPQIPLNSPSNPPIPPLLKGGKGGLLRVGKEAHPSIWLGLSFISFILSILSKEMAVTFPITLFLYELILRRTTGWKDRVRASLIILCSAAAIVIAYIGVRTAIFGGNLMQTVLRNLTPRLATETKVILQTIGIFLFPIHLTIDHEVERFQSFLDWRVAGFSVLLSGIIGLIFWWSRSPHKDRRLAAFLLSWFFTALLPIILLPLNMILQENRAYLAVVGLIGLIAMGLFYILDRGKAGIPFRRQLVWISMTVLVLVYGEITIQRNRIWQDDLTLWSDVVQKNPSSVIGIDNLGVTYRRLGRLDEAAEQFRAVLRLYPNRFVAIYNLGLIADKQGHDDEAEHLYRQTLQLEPQFYKAHLALGLLYERQSRLEESVREYSQAVRMNPELHQARLLLGGVLSKTGRYQEATGEYMAILQKGPNDPELEAEVRTRLAEIQDKDHEYK